MLVLNGIRRIAPLVNICEIPMVERNILAEETGVIIKQLVQVFYDVVHKYGMASVIFHRRPR